MRIPTAHATRGFCSGVLRVSAHVGLRQLRLLTFWILYPLNRPRLSMKIHGKERPKYTTSCMTKDMIPVARTSFCIHAYQAAHRRSATFKWALYLETSSNWDQYVPADSVEFLEQAMISLVANG